MTALVALAWGLAAWFGIAAFGLGLWILAVELSDRRRIGGRR